MTLSWALFVISELLFPAVEGTMKYIVFLVYKCVLFPPNNIKLKCDFDHFVNS